MSDWSAQNLEFLNAALAEVRARLEAHAAGTVAPVEAAIDEQRQIREQMAQQPALDVLVARFGLSRFERDVLLLCAGTEFDASFLKACADAQGDPRRTYATFSLALAALPEAHWSALTPLGVLRRWRLLILGQGTVTTAPLTVDEQILHFLAGVFEPNAQLVGVVEEARAPGGAVTFHAGAVARVKGVWLVEQKPYPVVLLKGEDLASKQHVAAEAAGGLGLALAVMRASEIPDAAADRQALARLWSREARLLSRALMVDPGADDDALRRDAVQAFLRAVDGPMCVALRDTLPSIGRPAVQVDVPKPDAAARITLWEQELSALGVSASTRRVAGQFVLGPSNIRAAAVAAAGVITEGAQAPEALWEACRAQARPLLDDLAQRIEPRATWENLVLPEGQVQLLRQMTAHVRQRLRVYEDWGFARQSARGLGISGLFSGPSGTGKTMAAEVLANELGLDLYRIDISSVVSKFIGETEKNLRRVFDAADSGGAVLLFDEADALFGKRSEVKDSRDRYANIEVGYLLQRMEAYQGLALLTTNLRNNMDQAFLRRIRFSVRFPFPDQPERRLIWERVLPAELPREGLDYDRLAQLKVAGGNIRNIAMNAAFLAADEGGTLRMHHVLQAARAEYAKLDKNLNKQEIAGWP